MMGRTRCFTLTWRGRDGGRTMILDAEPGHDDQAGLEGESEAQSRPFGSVAPVGPSARREPADAQAPKQGRDEEEDPGKSSRGGHELQSSEGRNARRTGVPGNSLIKETCGPDVKVRANLVHRVPDHH